MLQFSDSKMMAKALKKGLAERRIDISHSVSLELVARQFGFADWNMLAARIERDDQPPLLPEGWKVTGLGRPDVYRIGLDLAQPGTLKIETIDRSGLIDADQFGSLMQTILADAYRGRTVRVRAELRARGAERGALWMRIDPVAGRSLRFDNMLTRPAANGPPRGNVEWTERSVVLEVPEEAATIHYGIMLAGGGELWARNFTVEIVDPQSVAPTGPHFPTAPVNTEFRRPD